MAGKDLEKFIERYPTYIEALEMLEDKDQRIAELEQKLAELKEKDNYHLRYELAGADETITNLKQQLAEKQNEIDEINKEFVQAVHDWKALCAKKDNEISKLQASYQQVKTQLAIQELEKVKEEMDLNGNSYCEIRQGTSPHNPTDYAWFNYVKFRNYLNQQIKELKGE